MHLPSHTTNEHNAPENDTLQLQTANGGQTSGFSSQRRSNGNIAQGIGIGVGSNNTAMSNNRRKNSLSYQHQQQQLQFVVGSSVGVVEDESNCVSTAPGRFSPHPNELYLHQAGKLSLPPPTADRHYNDATAASCCLPPPSPAPNSDRYIVNGMQTVTSANQVQHQHHHHYQQQQQTNSLTSSNSTTSLSPTTTNHVCGSTTDNTTSMSNMNMLMKNKYSSGTNVGNVQRALSPSSRYRLERYRDTQQQKASKHVEHSSNHHPSSTTTNTAGGRFYLPSNATQLPPLVPSETYTYLTSTVHTPVKRYVPTPPPASDNFHVDMPLPLPTAQSPTMLSTNVTANANVCVASAQYVNTLPYVGYRMKCCSNEQHTAAVGSPETLSTLNKSTQSSQCISSGSTTTATTMGCSPIGGSGICKGRVSGGGGGVVLAQTQTTHPIHIPQQQQQQHVSGNEYANTLSTQQQQQSNHTSAIRAQTEAVANTAGTCLHCNTARRTTGVHQTTQTTGPISPVPVTQQNFVSGGGGGGGVFCPSNSGATHEHSSVALTPSTTESHISPLSPSMYVQQQQPNNHQQQQQQQTQTQPQSQIYAAQQQQQKHSNVIVTAATQRLQQQQQQINSTQQLHQQQHHHHQQQQHQQQHTQQQQQQHHQHALQTQQQRRYSRKKRLSQYLRKKIARFFGVEPSTETEDFNIWLGRHRRLALRRFGVFNDSTIGHQQQDPNNVQYQQQQLQQQQQQQQQQQHSDRPDILPVQNIDDVSRNAYLSDDFQTGRDCVERKVSVAHMFMSSIIYIVNAFNYRQMNATYRHRQWSRSFAPIHVENAINSEPDMSLAGDLGDGPLMLMDEEMFFDAPGDAASGSSNGISYHCTENEHLRQFNRTTGVGVGVGLGVYMSERQHGWRTTALNATTKSDNLMSQQEARTNATQQQLTGGGGGTGAAATGRLTNGARGTRISAQLLDGVLENSRRPQSRRVKYFAANELDDRNDHRPFFTYWINTVQIIVLSLSLLCYGIAPIGFGSEQKTGQVLVTSLSLQTVQHLEQRNFWIGPRNNDLVHMGAKFAACMRRDVKIIDVLMKTRRQERETACCIRNDDSGCVQSSQADCSVRGLFPTKSISTWKKWSPGESGPGGRISGSVCGLDPKFCDAPASIAPYEWPDDITKWPICRKTNSFSQRFRYKDHTAEHMVCEVIGHPCCTGVYGECRITTREYCDFVNGYFHEEASLCSQISCLNNVCGMFPFLSIEVPDQLYRLLTSLCMHAGILHLAITVLFQHIFLADLERLIGPIRTAVVYIGSGLAGNLTSAVLVPYKPEVGPSAALCGVLASLTSLLLFMHWQHLHKPHVALFKLALLCAMLFGIGTLPYQLNFAGLLAGAFCGALLTISLIPFVSVNKYKRKSKINLIWSCVILHVLLFSTMTVVFYVFPMEFTNLNFGDGPHNNINPIITTNAGIGVGGSDIISSGSRIATNSRQQSQKPQFYYHHHSDDIIRNSAALTVDSKITRLIQNEVAAETRHNAVDDEEPADDVFVSRSFIYTTNNTNSNEPSGKLAYQHGNNDYKSTGEDDDFFSVYKNIYKQGNRTSAKFNNTAKNNSNNSHNNKAQRLSVAVVAPTNLLKPSKSSNVVLLSSRHFSSYNNDSTAVKENQKIYKDINKLKHFAGDAQNQNSDGG